MAKNTELLDQYQSPTVLTYGKHVLEFEPSYMQPGSGNYDSGAGSGGSGSESFNWLGDVMSFLKRMF